MIVSIAKSWRAAEARHHGYVENVIAKYLEWQRQFVGPQKNPWVSPMVVFILFRLHAYIVSGDLDGMTESIRIYKGLVVKKSKSEEKLLKAELKKALNYDAFISKTGSWNAYELCKRSLARLCPYCNQAYARTVVSESKGFRPSLDHFFSQEHHPHLALTLNNLIPSCTSCNSNLKARKDFYAVPHLHPLFDEENIEFFLKVPVKEIPLARSYLQSFSAEPIVEARVVRTCQKSANSLSTFLVNERYVFANDEAVEFVRAKLGYDSNVLNYFNFPGDVQEQDALRFDARGYRHVMLGKMYRGIYDQLEKLKR